MGLYGIVILIVGDLYIRFRELIALSPYIWYNKLIEILTEGCYMAIFCNKLWELLVGWKMSKVYLHFMACIITNTITKLKP